MLSTDLELSFLTHQIVNVDRHVYFSNWGLLILPKRMIISKYEMIEDV